MIWRRRSSLSAHATARRFALWVSRKPGVRPRSLRHFWEVSVKHRMAHRVARPLDWTRSGHGPASNRAAHRRLGALSAAGYRSGGRSARPLREDCCARAPQAALFPRAPAPRPAAWTVYAQTSISERGATHAVYSRSNRYCSNQATDWLMIVASSFIRSPPPASVLPGVDSTGTPSTLLSSSASVLFPTPCAPVIATRITP
jgi:hypothetical protein